MDTAISLRLMGRMQAWTRLQADVLPSDRRTRTLLAVVAIASPRPVPRQQLAALLWHDRPVDEARLALRQELYKLRDALAPAPGPTLEIARNAVTLPPRNAWIDVQAFIRAAPERLGSMPLPEGDLLEDLQGLNPGFDTWLEQQRGHLRNHIRTSAEALLRRFTSPGEAIGLAGHLLRIDPTDERAWRTLMSAQAERGEHQLAENSYIQCCRQLAERAKCLPSAQTQALAEAIRGASAGTIHAAAPPLAASSASSAAAAILRPIPGSCEARRRVHIGVLPMDCAGLSDAGFGAAVAADIAVKLARHQWINVVPTENLRTQADANPAETRHISGIDLLLRGTISRTAAGLRVALQLVDLRAGGRVVWAGRFDRTPGDLALDRGDIAAQASAQTEREILSIEVARAATVPEARLTPYTIAMRAIPMVWQLERETFIQAGLELDRALALDPRCVLALTIHAFWHIHQAGQGWVENRPEATARAAEMAQRAVNLQPHAARPSVVAGHVQAFLQHDLDAATASHARALKHNPDLPVAWALSAATCLYRGDLQEAAWRGAQYKLLLPFDPFTFYYDNLFTVLNLLNRNPAQAASMGRRVTELNPRYLGGYTPYLAALGHLGDSERAEPVLARLLALQPGFTVDSFLSVSPLAQPRDRDHYAEGLRRAGAP